MLISDSEYLAALTQNIEAAKAARPSQVIEFRLCASDKCEALRRCNGLTDIKNAIYIISRGLEVASSDALKSKLIDFKKQSPRMCPKINGNLSEVLYVGSSTTGVSKRLKQHLGYGPAKTYSLHLCHWLKGDVRISIFEYQEVKRDVLQLIEDAISAEQNPMFGKQGGNNK